MKFLQLALDSYHPKLLCFTLHLYREKSYQTEPRVKLRHLQVDGIHSSLYFLLIFLPSKSIKECWAVTHAATHQTLVDKHGAAVDK